MGAGDDTEMQERDPILDRYRAAADAVVAQLKQHPKVIGVAVCGSLVAGEVWERSDVDILAVLRDAQVDWHALSVMHGDVRVHLQLLSERLLATARERFQGGVISQLLALSECVYDPDGVLRSSVAQLVSYPRDAQLRQAVKHFTGFLAEYHRARKCVRMRTTEDAFLHTNLAFRELAFVAYARRGLYPQRMMMDELIEVSPETYRAYVWFIHGKGRAGDRMRRSFAFFERMIDDVLAELGPLLLGAFRSQARPMTEEDLGQVPAVYDQSADLEFLVERLVQKGIVREDHRAFELEGITLSSLSETLFDLF